MVIHPPFRVSHVSSLIYLETHILYLLSVLQTTDAAGEIFSQFLDLRLKMFEILVEGYSRKRKRPK